MKPLVFISHSSKDKEIAEKVCLFLEANSVPCWIAPRDVTPGPELWRGHRRCHRRVRRVRFDPDWGIEQVRTGNARSRTRGNKQRCHHPISGRTGSTIARSGVLRQLDSLAGRIDRAARKTSGRTAEGDHQLAADRKESRLRPLRLPLPASRPTSAPPPGAFEISTLGHRRRSCSADWVRWRYPCLQGMANIWYRNSLARNESVPPVGDGNCPGAVRQRQPADQDTGSDTEYCLQPQIPPNGSPFGNSGTDLRVPIASGRTVASCRKPK